ncbi:MAG: COQ9 family protein [Kordiimonadaceae bacterium]|jgi:ubiquinone biosynthesis protein COQ9|nr:COQ9 family protein [Kordiimonadaceae bacterium]MBT6033918.1 COQ9 family protein [Kordiimonadaceae bacterium]
MTKKNAKKNKDKTPDELRDSLLSAALNHVAFDGWSAKTHVQAAKDIGVDKGIVTLAFPNGSIDMIDLHAQNCDQQMLEDAEKIGLGALKIREKITQLVKLRIIAENATKEATHRTIPFLALPKNHFASLKILYRSVDLMWKAISDSSTDFNFYTKRMTLAGVYSSTFLFWMSDETEDSVDTWAFLDRRIENVMQIEKAKAKYRNKDFNIPNIWRELGKKRYGN